MPRAWRDRTRRWTEATTPSNGDTDLWIWLASAALSVAVGFRFFGHYYLQLLPPLVLLSAGVLVRRTPVLLRATVGLSAAIAVVFSLVGFWVHPFGERPEVPGRQHLPRPPHVGDRPDLRVGSHARDLLGLRPPAGEPLPQQWIPDRGLGEPAER